MWCLSVKAQSDWSRLLSKLSAMITYKNPCLLECNEEANEYDKTLLEFHDVHVIINCELLHLSLLFLKDKQLNEKKGMHQKMRLFKKCVLGYLLIKLSKQGFVVYFPCIILVSDDHS